MAKPVVLVSAPKLIGAEKILLDGGVDITYMPYPVNEETLIAQFERQPVDALLARPAPTHAARAHRRKAAQGDFQDRRRLR